MDIPKGYRQEHVSLGGSGRGCQIEGKESDTRKMLWTERKARSSVPDLLEMHALSYLTLKVNQGRLVGC